MKTGIRIIFIFIATISLIGCFKVVSPDQAKLQQEEAAMQDNNKLSGEQKGEEVVDKGVKKQEPMIQPYVSDTGQKGAKVTPDRGEAYYVEPDWADMNPGDTRESSEPTTSSFWDILGW